MVSKYNKQKKVLALAMLFCSGSVMSGDFKILSPEGYFPPSLISDFEKTLEEDVVLTNYSTPSMRDSLATDIDNLIKFDVVITDEKTSFDIYALNHEFNAEPIRTGGDEFSIYLTSFYYGIAKQRDVPQIKTWSDLFNLPSSYKNRIEIDDEYDAVMLASLKSTKPNSKEIKNNKDINEAAHNFFRFTQRLAPKLKESGGNYRSDVYLTTYSSFFESENKNFEFIFPEGSPVEKKFFLLKTPKKDGRASLFFDFINDKKRILKVIKHNNMINECETLDYCQVNNSKTKTLNRSTEMRVNYIYERMIHATFY